MAATSVNNVAKYILEERGAMTAMKLQKLCYYSQAWSLVWDEEPLFNEEIQAWANGPVIPSLFEQHRGKRTVNENDVDGDSSLLTESQKLNIDQVIEDYGHMSGDDLSELTHMEAPWNRARAKEGLSEADPGRVAMSTFDIYHFYTTLYDQPVLG